MKKIILSIAICLISFVTFGQAPQQMSYQTVIRNSSGTLVANQIVGMRISILQGSNSGTAVYVETQTPTTNINGLASLSIGTGTIVTGTFAGINWGTGPYFIKTEADPTGGTNYTITGTNQFLSVPYALYALSAGSVSTDSVPFKHYIGDLYGGGIVVSVWDSSGTQHGLIASLTDLASTSEAWSNVSSTLIGSTAQHFSNGNANMSAIISQVGETSSAAQLCQSYNGGGFADWYLPSIWELGQCYNSAAIVNHILGDVNGFQPQVYWSSTEATNVLAWAQGFNGGSTSGQTKSDPYSVRAVRRF